MKNNIKLSGGVKFLSVVLFCYVIVLLFNSNLALSSLILFLNLLKKIIPLLVLVFFVMVIVNLIFTKKRTEKYLGQSSGLKSWIAAMLAGILIGGPPYILYPMLGDLKNKGMSNSLIAVLLFNGNVKIPFLPALVFYFGLEYTIVLSAYIILFSILNGLLIKLFVK